MMQEINANTTVVVHPLVLLSVVDHAHRVGRSGRKRVVGVLLGQNDPHAAAAASGLSAASSSKMQMINVANSFAVPFEEDERDPKTWFLDHNFIESMAQMFRKVNTKEKIVGWYHSGPKLRQSDLEINELFKRFVSRPVMLIVDVREGESGFPTDAYIAMDEIKDDGTTSRRSFMHVPSMIGAEEAEEIGVEHLLRDVKDTVTGTLSTRVSHQLNALRGLASRLTDMSDYLAAVGRGELPVNHEILANLQDMFNLLPKLESGGESTQSAFSLVSNDGALMVYLSSLMRAVIALHHLVDNKLTNARSEREGEKTVKVQEDKKETKVSVEAGH